MVVHSVLETPIFSRRADALLTRDERAELIATLAIDPMAGDVIPGTGGVRKLRFGAGGRGKRGGFRVVYYVLNDELPLVAIILYGKNEQADLTPDEKRGAEAIVAATKAEMARRKADKAGGQG
jgi:mRNA-degrading endonuclease RelE of RelBE toxin-antitoxin system